VDRRGIRFAGEASVGILDVDDIFEKKFVLFEGVISGLEEWLEE
jgi:hypothetical protein